MQYRQNSSTLIYTLCALTAFGIDQFMNLEFMLALEGGITSLVLAVPVAGLICCITWAALLNNLKERDIANSLLLGMIFFSLATFSLGASIYRAGASYDRTIAETETRNSSYLQASKTLQEAKTDWEKKDEAVRAEIEKGGCGPVCLAKQKLSDDARQRYDLARHHLQQLGVPKSVDPLAERLSRILSIPQQDVQTIYPLLLPIGIWLASIAFTGLALREVRMPVPQKIKPAEEQPLHAQIRDYAETCERKGKRPTHAEIAKTFGVSRSTVSRYLARGR